MVSPPLDQEVLAQIHRIVEAVRDLGWNIAVLMIRDCETRTTYPVAIATIDPALRSQLLAIPPVPFRESVWRQDRFRVSRSYFVDHRLNVGICNLADEFGGYQRDLGPRDEHEWQSDDFLIVPLVYEEKEFGWILVDDPADCQRPTLISVRTLEIFADQAALTIQQARILFQLRKQMAQQKALNELTHTITRYPELDDLFLSITCHLEQIFSSVRISIILRDEQLSKARLFVKDVHEEISSEIAEKPTVLERMAFDLITQQNPPHHIITDLRLTSPLKGDQRRLWNAGIRSYAILPLKMWDQVIGALSLAFETHDTFSPDDEDFLLQVAEHLGGSLWNALLHEVEQKRRHIADVLIDLSKIVNSTLDLDEVLKRALEQLARVLPFDTSTVLLPEGDSLRIAACWGFNEPEKLVGATFRVEEDNISHRVMRSQQVRVVDDVQKLPEWGHDREDLEGYKKIRAWIGAPLIVREQSIGLLVLDSFAPAFFTEEDGEVVSAFAAQIAIAIHNARLYEATQKQRDRLTAILTDTTDAIVVLDVAGDIWLMNPAARRNLKIQHEHFMGLPVNVLGLPDLNNALALAQATNEPTAGEIMLTDGTVFYASIAPVTDVGWVIVMQDITPLKELDRLRTEWVAAVSHDLKNPIQMIQLGAALLETDGLLNKEQIDRVNIIRRGAEQLRSLVVDVLDLARLEAGPSLNLAELNAAELVKSVLSEVEHLAVKKRQQITSHIPSDLPVIHGDIALLQRALSNLLSNAIKYTPSGGEITVGTSTSGDHMRFEISDNGTGIPVDSLPHLFDRFFRVPNTEIEGTGLGLSIVKSIVEKHRGTIEVTSIEGQGSTFVITLPIGRGAIAD